MPLVYPTSSRRSRTMRPPLSGVLHKQLRAPGGDLRCDPLKGRPAGAPVAVAAGDRDRRVRHRILVEPSGARGIVAKTDRVDMRVRS